MDLDYIYNELFDEDHRLHRSKASSIEFLTNSKYIKDCLIPGAKILDIGAGTGAYSIYFAQLGYDVTSVEPVKKNLDCLKAKVKDNYLLKPYLGNALDLSMLADGEFDVVLNMGPLYHLKTEEERIKAIMESVRVCKKGGKIFFAYISNDMVFVTESLFYNPHFLKSSEYHHDTFKVKDEPFTFLTPAYISELMIELGYQEYKHFASDGLGELLEERINVLSDEDFNEWLRFHFYTCEKKEMLGASHHLMYVIEK